MPYTRLEIFKHSQRIGKSVRTLRRWVARGCDLNDADSVGRFLEANKLRETNIEKSRRRRGVSNTGKAAEPFETPGNGELPPAGRKGAAATLQRLEHQEEESFRRLQSALQGGDRFEIDACQTYWLKVAETLRRSDASIDLARRQAETQIPLRQAEDVATAISEWLRIAFAQFLSSETQSLMGIREIGEYKAYAFERFKGIIDLTVRNALKTNSPVPDWASRRIKEAWNV
jgi:hypothetical protein